ncbi:MAG: hypothetical protein M3P18_01565 [Actinomycetota bacterium]|nr:hypothetical protein [Actinomycetota bacterium]
MDDSFVFDPAHPTVGGRLDDGGASTEQRVTDALRRPASPSAAFSAEDLARVADAARWAPSVHKTRPQRVRA